MYNIVKYFVLHISVLWGNNQHNVGRGIDGLHLMADYPDIPSPFEKST
jgi:hypothetical protein